MSESRPRDLFDKAVAFKRHQTVQELGLYPYFRPLVSSEGSRVVIEDKARIMLGSNNYLGLTHHPEVVEAARDAIENFGTSCTGSRDDSLSNGIAWLVPWPHSPPSCRADIHRVQDGVPRAVPLGHQF